MGLAGLFLVVTGVVMNLRVLRRPRIEGAGAVDVMQSGPWLVSVAIIGIGILLLAIAH